MEKTWRWFGKKDKITLDMLRQIGVEGIVTALHDVPNGEIWTEEAINDLKTYIESYGLRWSVVESLPVCEAIKYAGPEREQLIENYKVSLANLGKCGVKTVCYNFMPVIDWIRTDLQHPWADGTSSLYFDRCSLRLLRPSNPRTRRSRKGLLRRRTGKGCRTGQDHYRSRKG